MLAVQRLMRVGVLGKRAVMHGFAGQARGAAEVIIGKQRNGPTGTVKLRWQPDYGLFTNNIEGGQSAPMPSAPQPGGPPRMHGGGGQNGKPKNFAPGV
mgnify:CR=1 FL=1